MCALAYSKSKPPYKSIQSEGNRRSKKKYIDSEDIRRKNHSTFFHFNESKQLTLLGVAGK